VFQSQQRRQLGLERGVVPEFLSEPKPSTRTNVESNLKRGPAISEISAVSF
jgi:hypothetical protein